MGHAATAVGAASAGDDPLRRLVSEALSECQAEESFSDLIVARLDRWFSGGDGPSPITLLPVLTCAGHGGEPARAAPLCAAWALVRLAAKLLDDVEDGDTTTGQAQEVNAATGVLALAHLAVHALERQGVPAERVHHIDGALSRMVVRAAGGQHRDITSAADPDAVDPDAWLAIALAKSGAVFAWTTWAGAAVAQGARLGGRRLAGYRAYGENLGVLIQIADDYNEVWAAGTETEDPKGASFGGPNLAVAYAMTAANGPTRTRLLDRLRAARAGAPEAGAEARMMITDLGAQAFMLAAGLARLRLASVALASARPRSAVEKDLSAVLEGVMPVLRRIHSS